jgi:uroporphyrinogen-III synthase
MHAHPTFAVGTATATAAAQAGFTSVLNADGDAAALADLVANSLAARDGTLVMPVGQGLGAELAASLRRRGFRVLRRVAYRAAPVDRLPEAAASWLAERQAGTVMFFSGETSRHFVRLLDLANLSESVRDVEAVSISERAAVALRPLPWRRIRVAAKPNQDAMLALLL